MERWLGPGLGALALLVGLWNTWTLSSMGDDDEGDDVVAAAEDDEELDPEDLDDRADEGSRRVRPPAAAAPSRGGPPLDRARMVERIGERDTERTEQLLDLVKTEAEAFAKDEHLDAATTSRMLDGLRERFETFRILREDVRTGKVDREDARAESELIKNETEANMIAILGSERFERLEARLAELAAANQAAPDRPGPPR